MICVSPRATINMLDHLGEGFDEHVREWQHDLLPRLKESTLQVNMQERNCRHVYTSMFYIIISI